MNPSSLIAEIERVLSTPIRWKDATAPEMAAKGAKAYGGIDETGAWHFLVVSQPRGSRGYDGIATSSKAVAVVHLPPALAERAFKLAAKQCGAN